MAALVPEGEGERERQKTSERETEREGKQGKTWPQRESNAGLCVINRLTNNSWKLHHFQMRNVMV